ncbi:hypothetical protein N7452_001431 [Penicillium brevicompactum]|uniref:Xylanolytic transcriptional activator regulatory domain-containing protein n=1 Tax=Penicillium brevicompactum TaxID=5074 RepID=A0A9W9R2D1_PENBR|nr:hypothetical protein N7452_001431 [Penicillium brevicompactum]
MIRHERKHRVREANAQLTLPLNAQSQNSDDRSSSLSHGASVSNHSNPNVVESLFVPHNNLNSVSLPDGRSNNHPDGQAVQVSPGHSSTLDQSEYTPAQRLVDNVNPVISIAHSDSPASNPEIRDTSPAVHTRFLTEDTNSGRVDSALNATSHPRVQPLLRQWKHNTQAWSTAQQQQLRHFPGPRESEIHYQSVLSEVDRVQIEPNPGAQSTHSEQALSMDHGIWSNEQDYDPANLRDWNNRILNRATSQQSTGRFTVNEQYHDILSSILSSEEDEEIDFSVEYFNLCLRLYMKRFDHILPVIHKPSFRPNSHNPLLVLSMCAIGSLFVGTNEGDEKVSAPLFALFAGPCRMFDRPRLGASLALFPSSPRLNII